MFKIWLEALFPRFHSEVVPVLDIELILGNVYPDFCKRGLGTLRRFNGVDTALH